MGNPTIIAALIGAGATLLAALIGVIVNRRKQQELDSLKVSDSERNATVLPSGERIEPKPDSRLSSLDELGMSKIWIKRPKQGIFDQETRQDYPGYCRAFIRQAPAGATLRLLSTAGDGIQIVTATSEIEPAFAELFDRNCKIQVILVDPLSPKIKIKQEAEDESGLYGPPRKENELRDKVYSKLETLISWQKKLENQPTIDKQNIPLNVRCVQDIPTINLVDRGNQALVAFQAINLKGYDSPVLLLNETDKNNNGFYTYCGRYFNFLFSKGSEDGRKVLQRIGSRI